MQADDPHYWRMKTIAKGCRLHGHLCHERLEAHHIISQQQLRKHGKEEHLWDERNGMALCEPAHRRHTLAVARVPYKWLTSSNIAFAKEMGLDYLLDRYYPKEKSVSAFDFAEEKIDVRLDPVESEELTPLHATVLDDSPGAVEKCPTCERALPRPHKGEEEKVRKGWTIAVPVAEQENGAEVLDTLLEECRRFFGHDENKKVRYYTLSQALALVVQNQTKLTADA